MNYREKKEIECSHPWANKLFVENFLKRRTKEKIIIDDLYKLFEFYPHYYLVTELYDCIIEDKAKSNVLKLDKAIKSSLLGVASFCSAEILNFNPSLYSVLGALAVVAGGTEVLYHINKEDLDLKFNRKQKKEVLKDFKKKCKDFEKLVTDYGYSVQDYILDYEENDEIDWMCSLNRIMSENEEYIINKKKQGVFKDQFDASTVLKFHSQIFDTEEFNNFLTDAKLLYEEKNKVSKIKVL